MKKFVFIFMMIGLSIQSACAQASFQRYNQILSKLSKKAQDWFSKKENKACITKAVSIGIGLMVIGGIYGVKRGAFVSGQADKQCPAGVLFYRGVGDGTEILLGKNGNNSWQDFGGLPEPCDKNQKDTASREAAEEISFILDDVNNLTFGKSFDVAATKTFKNFLKSVDQRTCFCIQSQSVPPYTLFVVHCEGNQIASITSETHREKRKIISSKPNVKYEYLEAHEIAWLPAKNILEAINQNDTHPKMMLKSQEYRIRAVTISTIKPALEKLLEKV